MSKPITIKRAKEALHNLRKLTPASPKIDDDLEVSIKEAIVFMAPDLIQMTKRGFTSRELSDGLTAEGLGIKPATLNRYLNDYLASKKDSGKSESTPKDDDPKEEKPEPESGGQPEKSSRGNRYKDQPEQNLTGAGKNPNPPSENPNPISTAGSPKSDLSVSQCNQMPARSPSALQG